MSTLKEQLSQLVEKPITDLGYQYLGIQWVGAGRHATLRIYVDSETGISVEDCAKISRQVSAILDIEDLVSSAYHLEISSPGGDRPLFTADHYQRFLGRKVVLFLHTAVENRLKWCGIIQTVCGETVIIMIDDQRDGRQNHQQKAFDLRNIREANLVPHF